MTQDQFAAVLGIKKSALSMIETGKSNLSERNKDILACRLNVNLKWLESGTGPLFVEGTPGEPRERFIRRTDNMMSMQAIPLYSIEGTAGLVPLFLDHHSIQPIDYIRIPNLPRCDGALYVVGDSMYPLLKSGDIVLYKQIDDITNNIFWGEMYLLSIAIDGEEFITVKYVQKSEIPHCVKLVSQNPHHADKDIEVERIRAMAFVKASIRMNSMR